MHLIVMHVGDMLGCFGHGIGFVGDQDMGVSLGGSYIGMAQQGLDGPYVFCGHKRIGRKGVSQVVKPKILYHDKIRAIIKPIC